MQYTATANANRRPHARADIARVFVECVTCGAYKILSQHEDIPNAEAVKRARRSGWQIAGVNKRKNTRCRDCRLAARGWRRRGLNIPSNDRTFANSNPQHGMYSRGSHAVKPIQRSNQMKQPDNPPLEPLAATTLPVELLKDAALMAHVEAIGEHGTGWAPPDPLKRCDRCKKHAAFYVDHEGNEPSYICGHCGPRVSIFRLPIKADDLRQHAADLALEQFEKMEAETDG